MGYPKSWMVYHGKSQSNSWMITGGTHGHPHFRKPPDHPNAPKGGFDFPGPWNQFLSLPLEGPTGGSR